MKISLNIAFAAGLVLAPLAVTASPLQRSQVSADVKWLLHLDVDALRKTQLGSNLLQRVVDEAGEDWKEDANIDLSAILNGTSFVMAYGTDFKSGKDGKGVLIWQGSKEVQKIASGFLVQQAEATKGGSSNVKLVREGSQPIYAFDDDMNIMVRPGGGLVLGRSIDQIDLATKVLDGRASSLQTKDTFKEYSPLPGGFFFLALANGFNKETNVPVQANVLKLADGGRVALGESDNKLLLQITLNAPNDEMAQRIKVAIQGILMLATLGNHDLDGDFMTYLSKNVMSDDVAKVSGKQFTLKLAVPVGMVIKQLDEHQGEKEEKAPAKSEAKSDDSK